MKWGLGESYDEVSLISKQTRAYIDICQPASTIGAMASTLMASLFYFYYTGQVGMIADEFQTIIFVVVTMGLTHAGSQALNQAEDAEIDSQTPHKQNRPIPSGIISADHARSIAWIMNSLALGRAFLVNWVFGVSILVLMFFGVFYNLAPIRAKERWVGIPWQAMSRGFIPYPAIWVAYGDITSPAPWILGLFMFFYVLGFQNTADIIDRHTDEEFGIRTWVVEYGVNNVVGIAEACLGAMMIVMGVSVSIGLVGEWFMLMAIIIPFCLVMLYHMQVHPDRVSTKTGNHPSYLWYYVGMVLCVSIPLFVQMGINYI